MTYQEYLAELTDVLLAKHNNKFMHQPEHACHFGVAWPWICEVKGNRLDVMNAETGEEFPDVQHNMHGSSEFWTTLEDFITACGEDARCGMVTTADAGRIFWVYDNRSEAYPTHFPDGRPVPEQMIREGDIDPVGGNFGWAINIDYDYFSEFGYASMYPNHGETDEQRYQRQVEAHDAMLRAWGPDAVIIDVPGTEITDRV